eukprot:TRINITY_DN50251_c0_g1_i1.p1 TRINITY_DN50251_c0_g1~~TRINITY_DN50251_c0_g1_i1.p1  ORF type:complete len:434 (-),score=59.95 TRINITY_DN50251_c0_g1_i1:397-1698(-)
MMDHCNVPNGKWGSIPREVLEHCLRWLPVESVLVVACAGSESFAIVHSEALWADLFQRDWRWLCPENLPANVSFRRYYLHIAHHALSGGPSFVVIGSSVPSARNLVDTSVLSVFGSRGRAGRRPGWDSFQWASPGRSAAGVCRSGCSAALDSCSSFASSKVLAAGGFDFRTLKAVAHAEAIEVDSLFGQEPKLTSLPRLTTARACPGLVATPEAVLVVGGGSSMFTEAEVFASVETLPHGVAQCLEADSSLLEWRPAPALRRPRCAAGVCATSIGQVFVVSGYAGQGRYEQTVEWADASCSEGLLRGWNEASLLDHARAGCVACFGPDSCVWAVGGGRNENESLDTVERLDPRRPRWMKNVPPMPGRRRCFAGGFGADRKLYVHGGWDAAQWHNPTTARLDPRMMRWEKLPDLYGDDMNDTVQIHFVSGCLVF